MTGVLTLFNLSLIINRNKNFHYEFKKAHATKLGLF
jgi:hypothetical protein